MRAFRFVVIAIGAGWLLAAAALAGSVRISGNTRGPGRDRGSREIWTFFQRRGEVDLGGLGGSDGNGNWSPVAREEGEYTFAVVDHLILRPGVIISSDRFNRVDMIITYTYDVGGHVPSGRHKEIGQTFVATGRDLITVDVRVPKGSILTLREDGPEGKRIISVPHHVHFASGEVSLEPGRTYYIAWTRPNGEPFEMEQVSTDNPYPQGTAFYDGKPQPEIDLRMKLTVLPPCQMLTNYRHGSTVYNWSEGGYGQTFTARGNSLGMIRFDAAYGDKPFVEPTVRILRGGPGGRQVGPTRHAQVCIYGRGEVPLTPGEVYYIEITEPGDPPGLNIWVEAAGDVCPGGHLYISGQPEPDRDLAFDLIEYLPDEVPPPPVGRIRNLPGDGVMKIIFDAPESMDICRVVVRRTVRDAARSPDDGELVAGMPVTAKGTYWLFDRGLRNGEEYAYTFFTVDAAGNYSEPVTAGGRTAAGMVLPAGLINGDFNEGRNGMAPYGWGAISFRSGFHFIQADSPEGEPNAVGWITNNSPHDLMLYQRVPVVPGRRYLLSANTYGHDCWNNGNANELTAVGIDPTGGLDPSSVAVVWSGTDYRCDEWRRQRVACDAQADVITVYLRGRAQYGGDGMTALFANVDLSDVTTLGDQ
jgi:hypothetical protein